MARHANDGRSIAMTGSYEFIQTQILPILGDYVDDFDVDGIFDDVAEYHENDGWVWKEEYAVVDYDALAEVLRRHEINNQ